MRWGKKSIGRTAALAISLVCLLWPSSSIAAPPANDDFANAQVMTGFPANATGTTSGATKEAGEPEHGENGRGHSIWYSWTAPGATAVTVDTCGDSSVHTLAVYTGTSVGELTKVAAYETSYSSLCLGHPQVSFNAAEGVTYRIAIDSIAGLADPVSLAIEATQPPTHDDFDDPYLLNGERQIIAEGTNAGATREPGEPDHGGDPGGSSVWFSWTAPRSGVAAVSACGSDFDTILAAYEGTTVGNLEPLGRTFADPLCASGTYLGFGVTAGHSYRFALDGSTNSGAHPAEVGQFFISAFVGLGYPQNDEFDEALRIGSPPLSGETFGETAKATREAGEPLHAGRRGSSSLWYAWTSRLAGTVTFDTCQSDFDTLLGVYEGPFLASLRTVVANDDSAGPSCSGSKGSETSFFAQPETTYWIAVDGAGNATGHFALRRRHQIFIPPDTTPPDTRIRSVSFRRGHRVVEIKFYTRDSRAHLRCKLDRHHSQSCGSPQLYTGLPSGWHVLRIVAIDRAGNRDPTPAIARFRIRRSSRD